MKIGKSCKNIYYKLMCFCNGLVFFAPVALLVRTSRGVTLTQFFLLQALLSLVIFFFEIPTGILSDRVGHKKSIVLSQILILAARGIFLFAGNIWFFVVEAVIEALANCFMSGTGAAYLYEICKAQGDDFMVESARAGAWGTVGFIVSTVSYSGLHYLTGLNGLIIATEIASFAALLLALLLPKQPETVTETSKEQSIEAEVKQGKFSLPPFLWKLLMLDAVLGLAGLVINFLYAQKLEWAGIPVEWMTPIILAYSALDLLKPRVMQFLKQKKEHRVYLVFTLITAAMFFLLFWFNNWVSVACMMVMPFFLGIVGMVQYKLENEYIDQMGMDDNRASLLSTINMGNNLLEIIFLGLSALVSTGQGNAMFLFVGIVLFITAFAGSMVLRKIRQV